LEWSILEGENPVYGPVWGDSIAICKRFDESGSLGLELKMGGKFHLKLNMGERPIANK
jgi:hypothetical protein